MLLSALWSSSQLYLGMWLYLAVRWLWLTLYLQKVLSGALVMLKHYIYRKYSHMPRQSCDEDHRAEGSIATGTTPEDGQGY